MSAVRGFVVLGSIAAVPLGLVYGHAAYVILSSFSDYEPQTDKLSRRQLSSRASSAYSQRTGVFASLPNKNNKSVNPQQAEKDRLRAIRRAEIQEGIRSELEWLHQNDLTCTL